MPRIRERPTSPARSVEPVHVRKLSAREPGDLGNALSQGGRPVGEGASRAPHAYVGEESDRGVVPTKDPNKGGLPLAEDLEGRARPRRTCVGLHGPHTAADLPCH